MKLIRVWPCSEINPLDNWALSSKDDEDIAVSAVVGYAMELLRDLDHLKWRVVYVENRDQQAPALGSIIDYLDLPTIMRACLKGDYWLILRHDSCRLLKAGYDYYFYFGLAHEDAVPDHKTHGVNVEDVSSRLIETDFFDL